MRDKLIRVAAVLLLLTATGMAAAQSTDRDHPTPMTVNQVAGQGELGRNLEYFYSFVAGPGDVALTLDAKSTIYATIVGADVYGPDEKTLGHIEFVAYRAGKREVKWFHLTQKQTLKLRVRLDHGTGDYMVRVEGAVHFELPKAAGEQVGLAELKVAKFGGQDAPQTSAVGIPMEIFRGTPQALTADRKRAAGKGTGAFYVSLDVRRPYVQERGSIGYEITGGGATVTPGYSPNTGQEANLAFLSGEGARAVITLLLKKDTTYGMDCTVAGMGTFKMEGPNGQSERWEATSGWQHLLIDITPTASGYYTLKLSSTSVVGLKMCQVTVFQ